MSVRESRSSVWEFVERDNPKKGNAKCKLCSKVLVFNGSTTTNLWNHVRIMHDKLLKVEKSTSGAAQAPGKLVLPPQTGSSGLPAFFAKASCGEQRARMISRLLAEWCARNVRPVNIVQDDGLRDVFKFVEPGYTMPSHTHVTNLLKRKHTLMCERIKAVLPQFDGLSFTTDIWTSAATEGYISLTCHYISSKWALESCCLGTIAFSERHTADNIAEKLTALTERFSIPKSAQVGLVHDQAANMEAAGRKMAGERSQFHSVTCGPHRLQNTIKQGLEVQGVSRLLASARRLVSHFNHSVVAMTALRNHQRQMKDKRLKFIQEVSTRWNSSLQMLERLIRLRTHTTAVLGDTTVTPKAGDQQLNLSNSQYTLAEALVKLLKPFEVTTTIWSAEKEITISCVIPMVKELARSLEPSDDDTRTISLVKEKMLSDLEERFGLNPLKVSLEACASALDPRFHRFKEFEAEERDAVYGKVRTCLQLPGASDDPQTQTAASSDGEPPPKRPALEHKPTGFDLVFARRVKKVVEVNPTQGLSPSQELIRFLEEDEIDVHESALDWWMKNDKKYPKVARLARKFLCVPASSTPSERAFSKSGQVADQRRSSLTPDNVNMFVVLNKNWRWMETHSQSQLCSTEEVEKSLTEQVTTEEEEDESDGDMPMLPDLG